MSNGSAIVGRWRDSLRAFTPGYFEQSPALRPLGGRCSVVLHGSTTLGIDDAGSDLDLWVTAPVELVRQAESAAGTRFFSFVLEGKKGHFNLETIDEAWHELEVCNFERIAELRRAEILADAGDVASGLIARARRPMRDDVRSAWICYHYIEMRSFHRNSDNPVDRGDSVAVLQALVPALNHALRAAMVLDREPYPYIKWLSTAARQTPTGAKVMQVVDHIIDLLGHDVLRRSGPEATHPLSLALRDIRQILIEQTRGSGMDAPWLDRWWVYMTQAKADIRNRPW